MESGARRAYGAVPRSALRAPRFAFSLLEVIVAMAIFLGAIIVLSETMNGALGLSLDIQLQDQANLRCQGKMSEVIIGAERIASSDSFSPFSDANSENWQWRMESAEVPGITGLYEVKIIVQFQYSNGKLVESRLSQMVLDPSLRGSTMDRPSGTTGGTSP